MCKFFLGLLLLWCLAHSIKGDNNLRGDDGSKPFTGIEVVFEGNVKETASAHVFKEDIPRLHSRHDLQRFSRIHKDYVHDIVFVIRPNNMDKLTRVLHDVSNPSSPNYGQHWTEEEVTKFTSNPEARDVVVSYLHSHGALSVSESINGEYITATAPIIVWETMLNTEFFTFHQTHRNGRVEILVRAEKYSVPNELDVHVESALNTIQIPSRLFGSLSKVQPISLLKGPQFHTEGLLYDGYITPSKIRNYYNMSDSVFGSLASTQAVYFSRNQYYSPVDLQFFQDNLAPPNLPVTTTTVEKYSNDSMCRLDIQNCLISSPVLQYIMSTSRGSPTTYSYSDLSLSDWLVTLSNTVNPPLTLTISYASDESTTSSAELLAFTTAAIKLGTMGVTIVAASGDDGAVGEDVTYYGNSSCKYAPAFPASNPYVVAVGATLGPESNFAEVVCRANGTTISSTSGGGFSNFYPRPSFQSANVDAYFVAAASDGHTPVPGYGTGRGYPDLSLAGLNYIVRVAGHNYVSSGTTSSAPTIAGFFSNINAARLAVGKGSLGWVNPALYMNSTLYANDVTAGDNRCSSTGVCCSQGFYATTGWDPATGLGSVNYGKLSALLVSQGVVNRALYNPSTDPSGIPTRAPSVSPSFAKTSKPSSAKPSKVPSPRPSTRTPSMTPTVAYKTNILASQGMTGVTFAEASTPSFANAIIGTVSQTLGVSSNAVSRVGITTSGQASKPDVGMIYAVNVTSGVSTATLIGRLETSISTGTFLQSLSAKSGINILSVSGLVLLNTAPTMSPTPSTVQGSSGYSVIFIAAVAGGGGLAVLIILLVCWVCCCCKRKRRMRRAERNQAALVLPHLIVSHEVPNASSFNKERHHHDATRRTPIAYPIRQNDDSSDGPQSNTESDEDIRYSVSTSVTPY